MMVIWVIWSSWWFSIPWCYIKLAPSRPGWWSRLGHGGGDSTGVFEAMITRGSCWHQFSCKWNGDHCDMLWVFVRHWRQLWENCFWMSFAGYPAVTSLVNWFIAGFPVYEPHHHTFSFLNSNYVYKFISWHKWIFMVNHCDATTREKMLTPKKYEYYEYVLYNSFHSNFIQFQNNSLSQSHLTFEAQSQVRPRQRLQHLHP